MRDALPNKSADLDRAPSLEPTACWHAEAAKDSSTASRILLVVAAALVDSERRVLVARRPEGKPMAGLWELPGGKVEPGETPEAALVRELAEELSIETRTSCLAPLTFVSYPYDTFHLLMPVFVIRVWEGPIAPEDGRPFRWLKPEAMAQLPMPPADRPLPAMLRDML